MAEKRISTIKYNYLNLPNQLKMQASFENVTIKTKYRADGTKLRKENTTITSGFNGDKTQIKTSDYLDGFQYLQSVNQTSVVLQPEIMSRRAMEPQAFTIAQPRTVLTIKTPDLEFFPTAEGFYDYKKDQYIYQYRDHLGNARVSFGRNSAGALEITDANDYYPFGMNHLKTGNAYFGPSSYKNYKYNGKELQETGMYDYGARFYMPDLGKWGVVDPLAEKYFSYSPFNYTLNNPVNYIDPFGMDVYRLGADGSMEWVSESKEDQIYSANQFNKDNSLIKNAKGFTVGEQGYISNHTISGSFENSKGGTENYSFITFDNEDTALGLHEYISNNVNVEFMVGSGLKNGEEQSIVGKNGALNEPASAGRVTINQYLDYFDQNSITLFGHNHPDNKYEIEPSGYEIKLKDWKSNEFTNISAGQTLNKGDYKTSGLFPQTSTLFMYNPNYHVGPKTVIYNTGGVKAINNGYYKKNKN